MIYVVHQKRSALNLKNVQYVGRPTILGNPFTHLTKNTKAMFIVPTVEDAVKQYDNHLMKSVSTGHDSGEFKELLRLAEMYRRDGVLYLSCWCKDELAPRPSDHCCHAEVLRREIYSLSRTIDYFKTVAHIWQNPQ